MSLISSVGNNLKNLPEDVRKVKRVLEFLNILAPHEDPAPEAGIMTSRVRDGIKMLQRDNGLPASGDILEGSDTARKIHEEHLRSSGEVYGPPAPSKPADTPPIPQRKPILSKVSDEEAKDFIRQYEDGKSHFYKDPKGNITIGVGQMVPDSTAAKALPLYKYDDKGIRRATQDEIGDAFSKIKEMKTGNYSAEKYEPGKNNELPNLKLKDEDIDKLFDINLRLKSGELATKFPEVYDLPPEAQKAMLDMMYNMGPNKFNPSKWNGLYTAIKNQDWDKAAAESHRKGVQNDRNKAVKDLFISIKQKQNDGQ